VIEKGYPAAGVLQPGDRLVAVDGRRGGPGELSERIASHTCPAAEPTQGCKASTAARVTVVRDGEERSFELTPIYDPDAPTGDEDDPTGRTRLGFSYLTGPRDPLPFGDAADVSVDQFWFITKATLELPARLINPEQRKEISGVVGSYETTRQTILDDFASVVGILAIISLSLAIVNLFPFLPLDGGHIFWAIVEKVRRKPVPFSVMERAGVIGFMLVILIFLVGLSNDIDRLSGEGFQVP
jgi:regulator of sigma E protease